MNNIIAVMLPSVMQSITYILVGQTMSDITDKTSNKFMKGLLIIGTFIVVPIIAEAVKNSVNEKLLNRNENSAEDL